MIQHRGKTPWRTRLWLLALVAGVMVSAAVFSGSLATAVTTDKFQTPLLPPNAGEFSLPIPSCTLPNPSTSCDAVNGETKVGSLTENGNLTVINPNTLTTLTIGAPGAAALFCLNPVNRTNTIYCIKKWEDIQPAPHLKLFLEDTGDTNSATNPAFPVQSGFFGRLQAGQDQQFALQGQSGTPDPAPHVRMRAGVVGTAANFGNPNFVGVFGQVPGATGVPGELAQAAVFDGDGTGIGINGQVAMRVVDADGLTATTNDRKLTVGSTDNPQEICLYGGGEPDGNCINRWSNEVVNYRDPGSGYLLLQSRAFLGGTLDDEKPITSQWGMVRVPGHASFTSVVVGKPSGQPARGDGICSDSESGSPSVDCPSISVLTHSIVTCSGNPTTCSVDITWTTTYPTTTSASYGRSNIIFDKKAAASTTLTLGHTIHLTGLSSNTTYNVRVMGVTASGAALSSVISFPTS